MHTENRCFLDELIETNGTKSWYTPELFERDIRSRFPEELEIVSPPLAEAENYNCFIYAFGLAHDHAFIRESHGFIYSAFVQELLRRGVLEKSDTPVAGDLVFYQDLVRYPAELTHAGVLQSDGKVLSKWAWGPLVKHALMDVPASSGDTVWYTHAVPSEEVLRWYEALPDCHHPATDR